MLKRWRYFGRLYRIAIVVIENCSSTSIARISSASSIEVLYKKTCKVSHT